MVSGAGNLGGVAMTWYNCLKCDYKETNQVPTVRGPVM